MYELGIRYDRPYRKSARIVGDTMGKYHPHGDSSIYDALVVMAQDFKKGLSFLDIKLRIPGVLMDKSPPRRHIRSHQDSATVPSTMRWW